jgi:hypothetical protein
MKNVSDTTTATYVSPNVWARELVTRAASGEGAQIARKTLQTARRIERLPWAVKLDLDAIKAPMHVYRWVAWSPTSATTSFDTMSRMRAALVQHLRRTFQRNGDGWFVEREHSAAFAVWKEAMDDASKRGLMRPWPDRVPSQRYLEAIAASAVRAVPLKRETEPALHALAEKVAARINQSRS